MGCGHSAASTVVHSTPLLQHWETRILQDDVVDLCVESSFPELDEEEIDESNGEEEEGEEEEEEDDDEGGRLEMILAETGSIIHIDDSPAERRFAVLCEGELFEDPDFPASPSSLSYTQPDSEQLMDIVWMRPKDMCEEPCLFVDGASRSDVKQGALGDCWLLSACSALAMRPDLTEKVIPASQPLFGDSYCGALRVRLWRFGRWVSVLLDDRLPTRNGALLYASSDDKNEFWVAFIEKAYAKLHGSYESLGGGHSLEALVDLTGGIAEKMELTPTMYRKLRTAFRHGAFITCAKKLSRIIVLRRRRMKRGDWQVDGGRGKQEANGLVRGHAYTVSDVRQLRLPPPYGTLQMVRVRNPWADHREWNGAWSDSDSRWETLVDEDCRMKMGVLAEADGEFWMEFSDFRREFSEVTIATLAPQFSPLASRLLDEHVYAEMIHGQWIEGVNAGGCRNDLEKFTANPQYLLTLTETDEKEYDQEVSESEPGKCSVIIGLMQEHRRNERNRELRMFAIAFFVYKMEVSLHVSLLIFFIVSHMSRALGYSVHEELYRPSYHISTRWVPRVRVGHGAFRLLGPDAAELVCRFPMPLISNVIWARGDASHFRPGLASAQLLQGSTLLLPRVTPLDVGLYRCLATARHPSGSLVSIYQDINFYP